jgi:tungstate transport system substrate-binding protein
MTFIRSIGRRVRLAAYAAACAAAAPAVQAQSTFIVVASTTSTEPSGLFKHLLPVFTKQTGIEVRMVALGTGQALDAARRGDADVVLVHDLPAEQRFVAEGFASRRFDVMYNDFVIVGPKGDPAQVCGLKGTLEALRRIERAQAPFISRGDRSGTHAAELRYWKKAGVELERARGPWYKETGSGLGPALNTASGMNAYLLTDRGTWLSFRNLRVLPSGWRREIRKPPRAAAR